MIRCALACAGIVSASLGVAQGEDVVLPCPSEPTDMIIQVGDIVSCSISPIGDTDLFRFDLTQGHLVMLSLGDQTGTTARSLRAELFDPSQEVIDVLTVNETGLRRLITPNMTGRYTLLVAENGSNGTAMYSVALQSIFPHPPEAQEICYDCVLADGINVALDSDVFFFEGTAGEVITLTLTDRTGTTARRPVLELFDPDGVPIDTMNVNETGLRRIIDVPKTGTYTALVRENGDDGQAAYSLALQRLVPLADNAQRLLVDQVAQGTISPVADSDVFFVTLQSGGTIRLSLTDNTGTTARFPVAEIYGPDKQLVVTLSNNEGTASWDPLSSIPGGDYTILVRESGDDGVANYSLALQCVFPPCPTTSTEHVSWGTIKSLYKSAQP